MRFGERFEASAKSKAEAVKREGLVANALEEECPAKKRRRLAEQSTNESEDF